MLAAWGVETGSRKGKERRKGGKERKGKGGKKDASPRSIYAQTPPVRSIISLLNVGGKTENTLFENSISSCACFVRGESWK